MNVTADRLVAAGIAPTQAGMFAQPLADAFARFDISTPARIAGFLGQCMVESGCFVHLEENLFYSDPARIFAVFPSHFASASDANPYAKNPVRLGSRVYANRMGNGDEASGDGYTYRGRSLIQITGRDSYADASTGLARDYVGNPNLLSLPADACLAAAWFWNCNKLNNLADAGAFDAITRAVNGRAMLQATLRKQYTEQALNAFLE